MSVTTARLLGLQNSDIRRRRWQRDYQRQNSFSLDVPQNLYDSDSLSRGLDSFFFDEPVKTRDEDRFFLYLPRNLSYCEVCSDVIRDHVQKKVRLLSNRLCQLEDIPPTPVDTQPPFPDFGASEKGNEDGDDGGLWTGKHVPSSESSSSFTMPSASPRPILKKHNRAASFPIPRREGKKVVRFADALGLELESIRYMMQKDIPSIIPSASASLPTDTASRGSKRLQLMPAFLAPSLSKNFMSHLRKLNVLLHSVSTADGTVYGIISVINLTFHKTVFVRYTVNDWMSYHDESASYLEGSSENDSDKFSFTLYSDPTDLTSRGHSLFFAVCFKTADGRIYWDNNDGKNYCIKCEIKELPAVGNHSWVHFL